MRQCSHWYRGTVNYDGVSAEHDVLVKKRRARSVDGLAAREARRGMPGGTAGLGAAAARLEGARPGIPELGPG